MKSNLLEHIHSPTDLRLLDE
ncbi:MAG: hypothetical protein RIR01_859, partial [Bacteroidota bacterium]